jgi:hypothetical protein
MVAPLISQSAGRLKNLASTIRRQQFITKTEVGPQTVQALAEAVELQAKVERERIESRERSQQAVLIAERRARKKAEPSFIETLFGK